MSDKQGDCVMDRGRGVQGERQRGIKVEEVTEGGWRRGKAVGRNIGENR